MITNANDRTLPVSATRISMKKVILRLRFTLSPHKQMNGSAKKNGTRDMHTLQHHTFVEFALIFEARNRRPSQDRPQFDTIALKLKHSTQKNHIDLVESRVCIARNDDVKHTTSTVCYARCQLDECVLLCNQRSCESAGKKFNNF